MRFDAAMRGYVEVAEVLDMLISLPSLLPVEVYCWKKISCWLLRRSYHTIPKLPLSAAMSGKLARDVWVEFVTEATVPTGFPDLSSRPKRTMRLRVPSVHVRPK